MLSYNRFTIVLPEREKEDSSTTLYNAQRHVRICPVLHLGDVIIVLRIIDSDADLCKRLKNFQVGARKGEKYCYVPLPIVNKHNQK
jgi:hypothetical protein